MDPEVQGELVVAGNPSFEPTDRSDADLWGRGYSDAPYDVPFDTRLFTTQILFALTSSPLSWTGRASRCFSVIGFSLGGGIAMAFAALFPQMLRSLVLLAPSGILRRVPADYMGDIIRAPASSAYDLRVAVGKLLGVQQDSSRDDSEQVAHEAQGPPEGPEPSTVDVQAVIQWQYDCCAGFVDSFVRTIRHGPLMGQQVDWIRVGQVLTGHEPNGGLPQGPLPLAGRKILMIFGAADSIVPCTEVVEDFESLCPGVGKHLEVRLVPGGHGFPVPGADSVVEHIAQFWALPDGRLYTP